MKGERTTVGVFDSGVGGLTVLKELKLLLPNRSFIYFADTHNCPYGSKGRDEIIRLSKTITDFLIQQGCVAIVVACNTATAAAIDYLRATYSIPFVGMEPAVKPAALSTTTKSIGILATKGTFNGRLYKETSTRYASNIDVHYQIGKGLVELVEQGKSQSDETRELLKTYIDPMLKENIDHLVLGCTHYPFFIPILKEILPKSVIIDNPAPAVAMQVARVLSTLEENAIGNKNTNNNHPSFTFYSSGDISTLQQLVNQIEESEGFLFENKSFHKSPNL